MFFSLDDECLVFSQMAEVSPDSSSVEVKYKTPVYFQNIRTDNEIKIFDPDMKKLSNLYEFSLQYILRSSKDGSLDQT